MVWLVMVVVVVVGQVVWSKILAAEAAKAGGAWGGGAAQFCCDGTVCSWPFLADVDASAETQASALSIPCALLHLFSCLFFRKKSMRRRLSGRSMSSSGTP